MTKGDICYQDNEFILTGALDFSNVMAIYEKSLPDFRNGKDMVFDFSKLNTSNSAAIALIVEWLRLGKSCKKPVKFKALSKELLSIAKAADLEKFILNSNFS